MTTLGKVGSLWTFEFIFLQRVTAFVSVSVSTFAVSGLAYAAVPVTSCGQVLSSGGYLTGDLDCTGVVGPPAVTLEGGTLDLRGYVISADLRGATVRCTKSCRVHSTEDGGALVGRGIDGYPSGNTKITLRIDSVSIDPVWGRGVYVAEGKVFVKDSTITNALGAAISNADGSVSVSNSSLVGNGGEGIIGRNVKIKNSVVMGNGAVGINASTKVSIRDSAISANVGQGVRGNDSVSIKNSVVDLNEADGVYGFGTGFSGGRIKIVSSEVTNNGGHGIWGDDRPTITVMHSTVSGNWLDGIHDTAINRLKVTGSTLESNGRHGIFQTGCIAPRITDTSVTGNATDGAYCGVSGTCADVSSCVEPKLLGTTTCETSYDTLSGFPGNNWGVCSFD